LSEGKHTLTIVKSAKDVWFYGFRVCKAFNTVLSAGSASFTLSPRQFKDVDGNMVGPANGFKLTLEMLRRKPDSALIWYEDFRDKTPLPDSYWTTLSGQWHVWQDSASTANRPYSQLEGQGQLAWRYDKLSDIHLRAQIIFPQDGSGRAGVFLGDLFCCLNIDTQRVELYEGETCLGSYETSIRRTPDDILRTDPVAYTVEMRKRGGRVRVYSGASGTLRFIASTSVSNGYAGIRSDQRVCCQLLRLGEGWIYEPYECFTVVLPDGTKESFGRITRRNCTWDLKYHVFRLTADVEEPETRDEDISLDYEFFHTPVMPDVACGGDYTVQVIPEDINIWTSRLFLGDADGFGILYYQDVDSLVYWSNQAAYRWKLRGMCLWSLGQEDMRLWEYLPKQI